MAPFPGAAIKFTLKTANGVAYGVHRSGAIASYTREDRTVGFGPGGRVNSIRAPSMDIRRGPHGERTVVSRRSDNATLVSTGADRGYLERTVVFGNRTLIQRSYYDAGRAWTRLYATYQFGGAILPFYVPAVYYGAAFYGWAYYAWSSPIAYTWSGPWIGFYSSYFSPLGTYPGGVAWLTDYVLTRTLADAYFQQLAASEAATADGGQVLPNQTADSGDYYVAPRDSPITPELKAAIADEVQRQLAYENATASETAPASVAELPAALKPDRIFVVSSGMEVTTTDQRQCSLSTGDVLMVASAVVENSPIVPLRVASSRRADCPAGIELSLSIQDLAEMQNSLRGRIDDGLEALRSGQGENGLPSAPPVVIGPEPRPAIPDAPPSSGEDVGAVLKQQQQEASAAEAAATRDAAGLNRL